MLPLKSVAAHFLHVAGTRKHAREKERERLRVAREKVSLYVSVSFKIHRSDV